MLRHLFALLLGCSCATIAFGECDEFVRLNYQDITDYDRNHRIFPVPKELEFLATRNVPRLFVHPDSYRPIDYQDYLAKAKLRAIEDDRVISGVVTEKILQSLTHIEQCATYLEVAGDIGSPLRPPVYIQIFRDRMPGNPDRQWIYIKYNYIFDWSGLAPEKSWLGDLGAFVTGGKSKRWHRLDIHTAAILGFDEHYILRTLTLMQHNYQRTYLSGKDFSRYRPVVLLAAKDTNELYLDRGLDAPQTHRVVPFLDDWEYLISPSASATLWAKDVAYGLKAGAIEVPTKAVLAHPRFSLATFSGLLAPPYRVLGMYVGRDGPPGYDYRALPGYNDMPGLVAMGAWHDDDPELLEFLSGRLKGFEDTDWVGIRAWLEQRLFQAMSRR